VARDEAAERLVVALLRACDLVHGIQFPRWRASIGTTTPTLRRSPVRCTSAGVVAVVPCMISGRAADGGNAQIEVYLHPSGLVRSRAIAPQWAQAESAHLSCDGN
jgi:hypothetical protein